MEFEGGEEHLWKNIHQKITLNIQLWTLISSKLYTFIALAICKGKLHLFWTCEKKIKSQSILFHGLLSEIWYR